MATDDRRLDRLITALEGLVRSGAAGAAPNLISREDERVARAQRESAKRLGEAQENVTKALEQLAKTSKSETEKYERAQKELTDALKDAADAQMSANAKDERLRRAAGKGFGAQIAAYKELQEETHGLSSRLAAAQKNASLFAASLLETHREIDESSAHYANFMRQCANTVSKLDKEILKSAGVFDELSDTVKKNLSAADFAKLRRSLGDAQVTITENLSKIGIEDLGKFIESPEFQQRLQAPATEGAKSAEKFHETMVAVAKQLQEQGHLKDIDLSDVNRVNIQELAQRVAQFSGNVTRVNGDLDRIARNANTAFGVFTRGVTGLGASLKDFHNKLLSTASIMGGLSTVAQAAKNIYSSVSDFNIAELPISFMEVQKASLALGIGFEDTVKFINQNKALLASLGVEQSSILLSSIKAAAEQYGYGADQFMSSATAISQQAMATGINTRNLGEMDRYMKESIQSFRVLAGVLPVTSDEYFKLTSELLASSDIQHILLGMDSERAKVYAKQLENAQKDYALSTASLRVAQEMVKAQEAQKRERLAVRTKEGAKAAMLAGLAGMDSEAQRQIIELSIKGRGRTAEEDTAFKQLMSQLGQRARETEAAAFEGGNWQRGIGIQEAIAILEPGGEIGKLMGLGAAEEAAKRAGTARNKEEAEHLEQLSRGSQAAAELRNSFNFLKRLIDNDFTKAVTGAAQALYGFIGQGAGGGGGGGIISDIVGDILGGAVAGGIMRRGMGGAGAAATGGLLSRLGGMLGLGGAAGAFPTITGIGGAAGAGGAGMGAAAVGGAALAGAKVLGAGLAGYAVGTVLNEAGGAAADVFYEQVLGRERDWSAGTLAYGAVDTIMGLFGASDEDRMREAEEAARKQIEERKKQQQLAQPVPAGTPTSVNTATPATAPVAGAAVPVVAAAAAAPIPDPEKTIVNASDTATHEKLSEIAVTLADSLEVLKQLVESGSKRTETKREITMKEIPSTYTAMTGKLPTAY